jgi:hypothetical protein
MHAGRGRGLFTTAAVSAGDVLLVAAPLALLYSEEGHTPENEELAAHLAAIAAAAPAAAGGSGGSSSGGSGGLAPWQRSALLQLRGPGAVDGQQQLPDLRQLLGPPDEAAWVEGERQQQPRQQQQSQADAQQQQLPGPEELTRIVFANCTGE